MFGVYNTGMASHAYTPSPQAWCTFPATEGRSFGLWRVTERVALFRLNMWYMRWGNTDEAMKMVRRFAEKSKGKGPA